MGMPAPSIDEQSHFLPETASRRAELLSKVDAAADRVAKRRGIAAAVGTTDAEIVDRIEQLGLSGDSARILDVLPLVHVAWADGRIQKAERIAIFGVLDARGIPKGSDAYLLVEALLEARPSETFLAQTLALLKDLAARSGTETADVVDLCAKVADASGGLLGLGARTSAEERVVLVNVARALGATAQARFQERFGAP